MTTFASLFGGFGGADTGAQQAGLELAWSIELDAAIAEVAHANLHHRVIVKSILDCDPMDFDAVDVLHASPPCTNASAANANAGETELDMALARKTAAFVTTLKPTIFTLENVWAYRNFHAWRLIEDALHNAGYWVSVEHVNAANMGVAQTRKRMIVRAVRGGFAPYLPEPVPWVGWYVAVADLIDTLPETQFAPWQLARLPELLQTVLVPQGGALPKAWLVDGANTTDGQLSIRLDTEPTLTVTSGGPKHPTRSLLSSGRIVAMTPRALARFQSFPDTFELPPNARLAAKGIGNAVPPLLYQRIIAPLAEGL